ncbi:hypothetical protein BN946_scf184843.g15 [Trametes cinnabarina]|uniref:AB hydrolase-1 domain-containing protein n=1 Tax=Pycnoporus cinnabarinus TaxID=5643 RepID=A0A060S7Y8_PYCCI|nr:hypothetical protein BN946_scf184843.g15 [Trametes cinnabarina]
MIGDSPPEYVFIRLSILALRSIAPLSILYVALSAYHGRFLFRWWLGLYAVAEAAFYLFVFLPRSKLLQKAATHPPLPSREEREALFQKCFERVSDGQKAYGWFFSASPDGIRRENIVEWLLWAIFGSHREGLKDEWADELQTYVQKMEDLMGRKIEEGWDQTVRCMKVTLDPVDMIHRPLLWYFVSLPHRSATKDPILFIHGIGIGLWPYVPFFGDLLEADPDVGIIAIENLSISMRISRPPLSRTEMLEALVELLDAHDIERVVVAAHSYGTVIAAHMLRDPQLCARVSAWLLVDPVPFLLHLPSVAYNFVYRAPRTANEWQLSNILWKEDLAGKKVAVVLCGRDQIVDAAEVRRYLTGEDDADVEFVWKKDGLEVLYYPTLDHSQVFDTKQLRRPMVDIVQGFSARPRTD